MFAHEFPLLKQFFFFTLFSLRADDDMTTTTKKTTTEGNAQRKAPRGIRLSRRARRVYREPKEARLTRLI